MTRLKKKTGGGNSAVTNRIQREPHGKPLIFRHEIPRTRQRSRRFLFVFWVFFGWLMYTYYMLIYVTHVHVTSDFFCDTIVSHDALLLQIYEKTAQMSHVTRPWLIVWMPCDMTHLCCLYMTSDVWMSHVTRHSFWWYICETWLTNESCHTSRDWVISLVSTSHGTCKYIHTMSLGTHMNAFTGWTKKT